MTIKPLASFYVNILDILVVPNKWAKIVIDTACITYTLYYT